MARRMLDSKGIEAVRVDRSEKTPKGGAIELRQDGVKAQRDPAVRR